MMFGMKSRDNTAEEPKTERARTFGTVLTKTTDTDQSKEQARTETADNNRATVDHETTSLELGGLMAKLEQIDKKLKHSEEDREVIRKELRYNKHEYLDNYFNLARATEEKIQQMSDKVNATDEEREKNIKKDLQQMKNRYDDVNNQLGSLETRMEAMSRTQAEISCAIQAKLDAILRNSTSQDRPAADRSQGNRVDFLEPQGNKQQSTPLPFTRAVNTAPVAATLIMKNGTANTTNGPGDSTAHSNPGPDAMTWASTWEMMNRTLESFATRTLTRVIEEGASPGKHSKNRKNSRTIRMDALTLG
ncbi:fibrinogen- and Ig-binding protein-like [Symsagittifera roscoffensis]|uniref:fibrinogen- and Ig-binding protein-like n=1 Tax=Symsagittifera roscoffensis TaxID=84072 RepID=UPI00307C2008